MMKKAVWTLACILLVALPALGQGKRVEAMPAPAPAPPSPAVSQQLLNAKLIPQWAARAQALTKNFACPGDVSAKSCAGFLRLIAAGGSGASGNLLAERALAAQFSVMDYRQKYYLALLYVIFDHWTNQFAVVSFVARHRRTPGGRYPLVYPLMTYGHYLGGKVIALAINRKTAWPDAQGVFGFTSAGNSNCRARTGIYNSCVQVSFYHSGPYAVSSVETTLVGKTILKTALRVDKLSGGNLCGLSRLMPDRLKYEFNRNGRFMIEQAHAVGFFMCPKNLESKRLKP